MRVAVVGCGMSPVGAGLGDEIDGHDTVIRANRAFMTKGKEKDWGKRTDILCVGNKAAMLRKLPSPLPFEVVMVDDHWRDYWQHDQKPLAGTFAALYAARHGAKSVTLYGIDLYADAKLENGRWHFKTVFDGHPACPRHWSFNMDFDRQALENLPCLTTWRLRRS